MFKLFNACMPHNCCLSWACNYTSMHSGCVVCQISEEKRERWVSLWIHLLVNTFLHHRLMDELVSEEPLSE